MTEFRRLFRALGVLAPLVGALSTGLPADAGATENDVFALAAPETTAAPPPGVGRWARTAEADLRLIAARTATGTAESVRLGLHFDLKPGWKIYWRSPGDAGYPPTLDWQGSTNLKTAEIAWPVPHRFSVLGIETAGYKDQVVLPITATLDRPGAALSLRAAVDYLICSEVCVPGAATVALDLPAGTGAPAAEAQLIERHAARVPGPGRGITVDEAVVEDGPEGPVIAVALHATPPLSAPDLFVEGPLSVGGVDAGRGIVSGPATVAMAAGGERAVLRAPLIQSFDGATPPLTLTIADGQRGAEVTRTLAPGRLETTIAPSPPALPLAAVLALAVLGGLVLNLMPCVLPVLSLKVLAVMGHGGAARRSARAAFLASSAGIVAAFLVLAVVLAALKAGGAAVGWGIQFQQPWFLTAMVVLLTLFAANLWGVFEVSLPGWIGGAGGALGQPHSLPGHFAAGAFATVLATPCSAPFLGTAVGFALAGGPADILAVFLALGLGMALPYLAIAAVPAMATRLPRPGPWMIRLKQVLGLALAGTAVWLILVLAVQVGTRGALLLAVPMIAGIGLLGLRKGLTGRRRATVSVAVAALLVAGGLAPLASAPARPTLGPAASTAAGWRPFDEALLASLVADGRVVFVDVTADWCITCKVNKAAVLDREPVAAALAAPQVSTLRADWTRPDDGIAAYLARFGRYGIPFNAVYGPGAPRGLPLPELLTDAAVLDALRRAAG
jgi:suppressor for copper-sensitivity B